MDLRQLQCFVAVVDRGTVTGAAADLRLAQSAVSRHVKALEHEMGVLLLQRWRGGMTPTDSGLVLFEQARSILDATRRMRDNVNAARHVITGRVRFSSPSTIAEILFPPLAMEVKKRFPLIQLSLPELVTEAAVRAIRADRLDIAIVSSLSQTEGLTVEPAYIEQVCYVHLANNKPAKIARNNLDGSLIMPSDAGWRRQVSFTPTATILEVDNVRTMVAMVKMGVGAALMPASAARRFVNSQINAVPVYGLKLHRALAWSSDRKLSQAGIAFLDVCREKVRELKSDAQFN